MSASTMGAQDMVLVPREPNTAMIEAGARWTHNADGPSAGEFYLGVYRAMLAAAPQPAPASAPTLAQIVEAEGRAWTPGPWHVSPTGFAEKGLWSAPTVYATDDELRYVAVCACADELNFHRATDNLANARLIAASPALYDACNGYRKAFEALFNHCLSNGVFNAWGKSVDCSELNKAQSAGEAALRLAESGQ